MDSIEWIVFVGILAICLGIGFSVFEYDFKISSALRNGTAEMSETEIICSKWKLNDGSEDDECLQEILYEKTAKFYKISEDSVRIEHFVNGIDVGVYKIVKVIK